MTSNCRSDQMLLSAFLANITDYVYFKDRESRFVSASLSIARLYGCTVNELLGKTDFDFYEPAQAQVFRNRELQIMATGESMVDDALMHTWPDGRVTWAMNIVMPMRDEQGNIIGVFGSSKDITAAKVMELELARANQQLRDLSRSAGMAEIANNVLHNLGNVLNSVTVSAGLIGGKVRES